MHNESAALPQLRPGCSLSLGCSATPPPLSPDRLGLNLRGNLIGRGPPQYSLYDQFGHKKFDPGYKGMTLLKKLLDAPECALEELDLSRNAIRINAQVSILALGVSNCPSLKVLKIGGNFLQLDSAVSLICAARVPLATGNVPCRSGLAELDLADNDIGMGVGGYTPDGKKKDMSQERLRHVARLLQAPSKRLWKLKLANCGFRLEEFKALVFQIPLTHCHVLSLDLSGAKCGSPGLFQLGRYLTWHTCVLAHLPVEVPRNT